MVLTAIPYDPERRVKKEEKKEIDERTAAAYARLIEAARHIDEEIYKEQQLRKLEKENNNLEAAVIVRRRKFPEHFRGKEYKKQVIAEIAANYPHRVYEPLSTVGDPKDGVKTIVVDPMW